MQESNFEKQVQQKLDELQLTPSEPVWQNIEVAIRKKKDRRLVFWMLPVLLLAGGLVWWQAATGPSDKVAQQPVAKTHSQPTFSKPYTDQSTQNTTKQEQPATSNSTKEPNASTDTIAQKNSFSIDQKSTKRPAIKSSATQQPLKKQNNLYEKSTDVSQVTAAQKTPTKLAKNSNKTIEAAPTSETTSNAVTTNHTAPTAATIGNNNPALAKDSVQQAQSTNLDSVAKAVPQLKRKTESAKRLQWSVVSRIGVSKAVESLTNGFGQKTYPAANLQADYSSWVPSTTASGYRQPALPTQNVQYAVGVVLKKSVGKKRFIETGLQYSYYSYNLAVGAEPAARSLVNRNRLAAQNTYFNSGKQRQQFTNTLQFIELPVGFEYQLLKNFPLHVQHGVTVSQLLSGNVLQYDYASNTYSQQSSGLRKTSINLFTAVDYTVWQGKGVSLGAGPHLQYGLQPLFKTSSNSHLLSGGLALTMGF